jgi:hypothetical protein
VHTTQPKTVIICYCNLDHGPEMCFKKFKKILEAVFNGQLLLRNLRLSLPQFIETYGCFLRCAQDRCIRLPPLRPPGTFKLSIESGAPRASLSRPAEKWIRPTEAARCCLAATNSLSYWHEVVVNWTLAWIKSARRVRSITTTGNFMYLIHGAPDAQPPVAFCAPSLPTCIRSVSALDRGPGTPRSSHDNNWL